MPHQLTQYAFLALKTTCHNDRAFKRRWRKIQPVDQQDPDSIDKSLPNLTAEQKLDILGPAAAERLANFGKPNTSAKPKFGRKTVNVAELIRKRKLLTMIEEPTAANIAATENSAVEAPIVQFAPTYF